LVSRILFIAICGKSMTVVPTATRDSCRICNSRSVRKFLMLRKIPLPMGHVAPGEENDCFSEDISLYHCAECGSVQTMVDYDLSDYYSDYAYTTGASPLVQKFTRQFAGQVWSRFGLQNGAKVLEIGSGDGTQLLEFQKLGASVLGFEPSTSLAETAIKAGVEVIADLFDENTVSAIRNHISPFDVVVAQYTFDHLADPMRFLHTVKEILDPQRGVLILEVHDFEKIVKRNEGCLLVHEHATFLTVDTMAKALDLAGFQMLCTDLVDVKDRRGNSLIVAAGLKGGEHKIGEICRSPLLDKLQLTETYDRFADDLMRGHRRLADHVREVRNRGDEIAGYGAAARGVNTLAIAGLTSGDVKYVCDMNEKLHGLLMPASFIPVASPQTLLNDNVDEVIVFNYGYLDEIKSLLKPIIQSGTTVVSMLDYLRGEFDES